MDEIDGIPFIWNQQGDNQLLGSLFPQGNNNATAGQLPQGSPHYGETIRGMMHVSPLVTQKKTRLSLLEIINRYFTDATTERNQSATLVCDVNSVATQFESHERGSGKFTYPVSKDYAYTAYIFYSKDAIKLAEAYECLELKEKQVVFFIEDNTDDYSERFGAVKIAEDLAETLKNNEETDLKSNQNLYNALKKIIPDISDSDISELLHTGEFKYTGTILAAQSLNVASELISSIFPLASLFPDNIYSVAATMLEGLVKIIDKAKFDDYRWDPTAAKEDEDGNADTSYDKEKDFSPVLFPGAEDYIDENEGTINDSLKNAAFSLMAKLEAQDKGLRSLLGITKSFDAGRPSGIAEFVYAKYATVMQVAKNKLAQLEDIDFASLAKLGVRIVNAFLCGLWNGLVDAVSSLVLLVKYLFDALDALTGFFKSGVAELHKLTEHFDNVLQAFKAIDFGKIMTRIQNGFTAFVTETEIDSTTLIKAAYFTGAIYGYIISLIIEIAVGILVSGGALSIEAIAARLINMLTDMLKLAPSLVKGLVKKTTKIAVKGIQAIYKMLSEITSFLRKGTDEILKMVDDLFKKIRKNKNEFIGVQEKVGKIFRVQGGLEAPNVSKFRFFIKNNRVYIKGDDMIHVTFDDEYRVAQFWTKRGKNAELFRADIDKKFIDKIKSDAIPQNRAKEFPGKPQIDDPSKTKKSYGIPKEYFDELIKSLKNPEIIKYD